MKTSHAVLVKVKGVFLFFSFFYILKRDYSTIPSIEEGNVENEPERMFVGAALSCALFWQEEKTKRGKRELKSVG